MPSPLTLPARYARRKPPLGVPVRGARGLVACYPFNEGRGGAVYNAAASRPPGTLSLPSGLTWQVGPLGAQLLFDGTHYLADASPVASPPATIEAWFWLPAAGAKGCLVNLGNDAGTDGWAIGINGGSGNMTTAGTYCSALYNNIRWVATGLHYVAGAMNQVVMAVDASGHPIIAVNGGAGVYSDTSSAPLNPTARLLLGQNSVGGGDARGLTAALALVCIWSRALSVSEIRRRYVAPFGMF